MKSAKDLTLIGLFTSLLIGGQFILSAVSGVEIVTVLFASFCYYYGVKKGLVVATCFSLIRCLIFGFMPNVIILYLVYYNLFALIIGLIGNKFNREISKTSFAITITAVCFLIILFTLLDDIITPLFYGYSSKAWKVYVIASTYTLLAQLVCGIITTLLLFKILIGIYRKI